MDLHELTSRLAELRQEIRDLQDQSSHYQDRETHSQVDESAQEQRRLRLMQIKDELMAMRKRPSGL